MISWILLVTKFFQIGSLVSPDLFSPMKEHLRCLHSVSNPRELQLPSCHFGNRDYVNERLIYFYNLIILCIISYCNIYVTYLLCITLYLTRHIVADYQVILRLVL
ncbi:hypothetical protein ACP275_04G133100 [Erythranthe tilingii]